MQIRELSVPDSFEITPAQNIDERGVFLEWYRHDVLEHAVGHALNLRQANTSVSKRGTVRGIHYADIPRGQAKYVTVLSGAVLDFVVDIRVGSPTFGKWDSVRLDTVTRKAIYLAEGLGHAFVALTEQASVSYLVSGLYNPAAEHAINPLDEAVGLVFPDEASDLLLSSKDTDAPSLAEAEAAGLLPSWNGAIELYKELNEIGRS